MARVELIVGSMFSGKSTELIRRCSRYEAIGKTVQIINHELDTRCKSDEISTHSNARHDAIKTHNLMDIDLLPIPHVVGIDEAQFFPDLHKFVTYMEQFNTVIIIAGLDGDFARNTFGEIYKILPLCDEVTKLSAMCSVCNNGTPGIFTQKLDCSNKNVIDIGGKNKFVSVCRKHYAMK